MKTKEILLAIAIALFTGTVFAYGGGSSGGTKACAKPKFSDFNPAENAQVNAGAAFSFTASANTYPNTIKVSVKSQAATTKVTPKGDGTFSVSGNLPASVKGGYARINIEADAQSNCKGTGGWLVKVAE